MAEEDTNNQSDSGVDDQDVDTTTSSEDTSRPERKDAVSIEEYRKQVEEWEAEKRRMQDALKKANKEAQDYRQKYKPFKELEADPEEVAQWKQEREEAEQRALEERQEWDKLAERLKSDYEKKIEKERETLTQYEQEKQELQRTLEQYLVDSRLKEAIMREGGEPEFLLDKMKPRTKVEKDDTGEYKTYMIDSRGDSVEVTDYTDLVKEFAEHPVFAKAFAAPESSGSGTSQNGQSSSAPSNVPKIRKSDFKNDPIKKGNFIEEYGFEAYKKLEP